MTLDEFKLWFEGFSDAIHSAEDSKSQVIASELMEKIKGKLDTVTEHDDCDCSKCLEKVERSLYDASRKFAPDKSACSSCNGSGNA